MSETQQQAGATSHLTQELGLCGSCKHWCRNKDDYGYYSSEAYNLGLGQCIQAKMLFDCVQWDRDGERTIFCKDAGDTKAFVQDGSDYKAWLLTKKDFGCVSWRAKTIYDQREEYMTEKNDVQVAGLASDLNRELYTLT